MIRGILGNPGASCWRLWFSVAAILLLAGWPERVRGQEAAVVEAVAQAVDQPSTDESTDDSEEVDTIVSSDANELTIDDLKQQLDKLPAPTKDAPATREYNDLQSALDQLNQEKDWQDKLAKLKQSMAAKTSYDSDLAKAKQDADSLKSTPLPETSEDSENALKALAPQLDEVNERVKDLSGLLSNAPQRRLEQTQRLNALKSEMNDLKTSAQGTDTAAILAKAKLQSASAESDFLDLSIASTDARKSSLSMELEIAKTRQASLKERNDLLSANLKKLRAADLKKQEAAMRESARKAAMQSPALQALAARNEDLLQRRKDLNQYLNQIGHRYEHYQEQSEWIKKQLSEIQERVSISGFSQTAATIMLKELRRLPHVKELEDEQDELEEEVRATQLELYDLPQDLNDSLSAEQQFVALGIELTKDELAWVKEHEDLDVQQQLLQQSREIVSGLRKDANAYFEALLATDSEILATMQATDDFRSYASENILWIPSRDVMSTKDVTSLPGLVGTALDEFTSLLDVVVKGPVLRTVAFVLILGLLTTLTRYWVKVTQVERQLPASIDKIGRTLRLVVFEVFVALLPMTVLYLLAWVLDDPQLNGSLSSALEFTAHTVATATFFLTLLYRITRINGLGQNHLRWPRFVCVRINMAVKRFLVPALLCAFVSILLDNYAQFIDTISGTRIVLLPSFILSLLALHTVFSPKYGILSKGDTVWTRTPSLRWGLYLFLMSWQLFLCTLVVSGYMLGAVMLWGHTFRTLWLLALVFILKGLVELYLEIQQFNAHKQERAELASGQLAAAQEKFDFELDDSMKQVISFVQWMFILLGVSAIWADAFPSMRKLGSHPLITFHDEPFLTLGQGGMLVLCVVTTVMLARSLPRLFEIIILRRIASIDPGSRHAFSTLIAYLVVVIGVIWASQILLIEWGNIQWLVAAISVGLGFGMQEIFGNLVAGIILLFERPIRVGDIITIGQTTGKVTRIQMRGTTIMEWDRRELIVPNKEFVTGQLTNWTLSDTLTRLTLNVGVAYGSEITKVKELLLEVIRKDPRVLEDPAPAAFFKQFGESSLDFLAFAYLGTLDDRLGVTSDLQQGIYEALSAADIKIPLPQRDIHIVDGPVDWPSKKTG
ncbi:mechanosensitive ion channel domain-containing protein [Cerasicoccus frondis]|uniref:mechanosensitive ion channel domain-containing protein n=1 Tax=Cerasicoccus frondis TaxID=490090 RepID=UPI0028528F5B|nr:mechanosensitive ion channel domain-containing protein [Cerasicoccus frondis]